MSSADADKIATLETDIAQFQAERAASTKPEVREKLLNLITEKQGTLNILLRRQDAAASGGSSAGTEALLQQQRAMLRDEMRPIVNALAAQEIRRLRQEIDCWHSDARTRNESAAFKTLLITRYQRGDGENVRCMITNESFVRSHVLASHIVKHCTRGRTMSHYGLEASDVNSFRNGLLLLDSIEKNFDRKNICFLYDPFSGQLRMHVLDPSLMTTRVAPLSEQARVPTTFGDLHGAVLQHPEGVYPFRRCLSMHAKLSFARALHIGWIEDANNYSSFFAASDAGMEEPHGFGTLSWEEIACV